MSGVLEAVGTAGSIVGIVGFAGQILHGLTYLCEFFQDVQGVPEDIAALVKELNALEQLIREITVLFHEQGRYAILAIPPTTSSLESPGSLDPDAVFDQLKPALGFCDHSVKELRGLIEKHGSTEEASQSMKTWNNLKASFKRKKFAKYTERLQRGKSMLIQSYLLIIHSAILDHAFCSKEATTKISDQMSQLALNQCSHTTILSKAQDSIWNLDQNSTEIRSALDSILAQTDVQRLSGILLPALEHVISNQIKQEFQNMHRILRMERVEQTSLNATQLSLAISRTEEPQSQIESAKQDVITGSPLSRRNSRRLLHTKSYSSWFGRLLVSTESRDAASSTSVRTEVIILPASWLLHTGAVMTIDRMITASTRPVLRYAIRPQSMVQDQNPIISAITNGNKLQVQQLFTNGTASPFDRTAKGTNLLGIVFGKIFETAFVCSQWNKINDRGITHPFTNIQDGLQLLTNLKEVARLLIELGVDGGARDDGQNSTPVHTCLMTLGLALCPSEDDLYDIAGETINKSKSNPLLVGCSSFLSFLLCEIPTEEQLSLKRIQHLFLENEDWNISSSHGGHDAMTWLITDIYLAVGARPTYWECWYPSRGLTTEFVRHRSMIVENLMSAAQDSKDDLLKDLETSSGRKFFGEVVHNLYWAIKTALIENSPLKRSRFLEPDFRVLYLSAIKDIAAMISFQPVVAEMDFPALGHESLTRWATRWKVLDLWRKSLRASRYDLVHITQRAWGANQHLYEPEDEQETLQDAQIEVNWEAETSSDGSDSGRTTPEPPSFGETMTLHPAYGLLS